MSIARMVRRLPKDVAGYEVGRQVLRSGRSTGANVEEADAAESTQDMLHKLKISLKEAQETRFWMRTIHDSELLVDNEVSALIQESDELVRIINTIISVTAKKRPSNRSGEGLHTRSSAQPSRARHPKTEWKDCLIWRTT